MPGWLGALTLAGAMAGTEPEAPAAGPPTIVLTRAMMASGKTDGFVFEAKGGTRSALHVVVRYARNEQDHLGRAKIRFRETDKLGLKLPVRVVTKKDGQDRAVFSVSATMAQNCFLEIHVLSRHPDKEGTDPLRIYTVELIELIEPDASLADDRERERKESNQ